VVKLKNLKSKIGMFFSGAYLLLIFVVMVEIIVSKPDAMSVVALILLAMRSVTVFENLPGVDLPIVGLAVYVFCVLLNSVILYAFGLALSVPVRWMKVLIDRQNESASKRP
jgi:hypothetical protein